MGTTVTVPLCLHGSRSQGPTLHSRFDGASICRARTVPCPLFMLGKGFTLWFRGGMYFMVTNRPLSPAHVPAVSYPGPMRHAFCEHQYSPLPSS